VIPQVSLSTASDDLPLDANKLPFSVIPCAFRNEARFSSAKTTSSSTSAFAVA
jgi:hypothetical protein